MGIDARISPILAHRRSFRFHTGGWFGAKENAGDQTTIRVFRLRTHRGDTVGQAGLMVYFCDVALHAEVIVIARFFR